MHMRMSVLLVVVIVVGVSVVMVEAGGSIMPCPIPRLDPMLRPAMTGICRGCDGRRRSASERVAFRSRASLRRRREMLGAPHPRHIIFMELKEGAAKMLIDKSSSAAGDCVRVRMSEMRRREGIELGRVHCSRTARCLCLLQDICPQLTSCCGPHHMNPLRKNHDEGRPDQEPSSKGRHQADLALREREGIRDVCHGERAKEHDTAQQ
mmetsp:Transcript_18093/g.57853  ORF Transcript_18093/g.57853 Transcript_18093/m.57853 type:complete len:208 (+) Transcript_18093:1041-1664(+)